MESNADQQSKMVSFAEQLRSLSNPEPSRFDLDEDDFDLTRAQVIKKGTDLGEIETQNVPINSNLRKKTVALLQDEDKKYAGRKISRAQLEAARGLTDGPDSAEESEEDNDCEDDMQNGRETSEDEDIDEGNDYGIDDVNDDNDDDDDDENDVGSGGVNNASVQEVVARKRNKHPLTDDFGDEGDCYDDDDDESVGMHSTDDENNVEYSGDNLDNDNDNQEDDDDDNYDDDDNDYDDDDNEGGDDDDGELDEDAGGDAIQNFSTASLTDDIEKGKAAKNQLSLWDSFLEMRIRLQKALLIANKLPQQEEMEQFNSSGDKNLKEMYKQGRKTVAKLLGNLLLIQEKLLKQNPDTVNVLHPGAESNKSTAHGSDDDEEIPSDTEDEKSNDDDDDDDEDRTKGEQAEGSLKLPGKRKYELATSEYGECISKRHAAFKSYRDATISKWSEKTRLASGKLNSKSFSSFDRSALSQINHILSDQDRLIKRTQLKRTAYRVLGKSEDDEKQKLQSKEEQSDIHLRDYDPEIFDDDDFYHQLLREFIEQRSSGSTGNPIEMGRQWLELQKLRRKVKKKVDTKASKGRKIRYDIHGKLVSFMAPIEKGVMTDSSRNELFCSLFGAKQEPEVAADISVFR